MSDEKKEVPKRHPILGLEEHLNASLEDSAFIKVEVPDDPHEDFRKSRANLYEVEAMGRHVLKRAVDIVENTSHPRAVEVFSGLLNTVKDVNETINDMTKEHLESNATMKDVTPDGSPVGRLVSTEDLLDAINDAKKQLKTIKKPEEKKD